MAVPNQRHATLLLGASSRYLSAPAVRALTELLKPEGVPCAKTRSLWGHLVIGDAYVNVGRGLLLNLIDKNAAYITNKMALEPSELALVKRLVDAAHLPYEEPAAEPAPAAASPLDPNDEDDAALYLAEYLDRVRETGQFHPVPKRFTYEQICSSIGLVRVSAQAMAGLPGVFQRQRSGETGSLSISLYNYTLVIKGPAE